MKIRFWGCRGSIPVPDKRMMKFGGNTSCIEVALGDRVLIIDAGTGIKKLGESLIARSIYDFDIFITHSHWDHIQGFPFFKPIYSEKTTIKISGCSSSYKQLKTIFSRQMSIEYFPIRFSALKSNIRFMEACQQEDRIDGYSINIIETNHPISTVGIRIQKNGQAFVFITDNELNSPRPQTRWNRFVDFCRDATYLIHDAQFTDEEYINRQGWGHSTFEQVIDLARDAGARNVGFFHHDPDREDRELIKLEKKFKRDTKFKGYDINIFAVREKTEIEIPE